MKHPILKTFKIGIDVGSTTAKLVIINENNELVGSEYIRHNTKIYQTVFSILKKFDSTLNNAKLSVVVTGSAGMGIAERTKLTFIQEVVASTEVIKNFYPEVRTLIDVGGEDSKMIFFPPNKLPDIRMNGSCAGGTGAFIDQMATLLNVQPLEMNSLAQNHTHIYPIASRCGVFAKTDVQNLISRKVPKEDIAASVFHAVAIQCINALARGFDVTPKIMFVGGPFTFLPFLVDIFLKDLGISRNEIISYPYPEFLPAMGAATDNSVQRNELTFEELCERLSFAQDENVEVSNRLNPLFENSQEFENWTNQRFGDKIIQNVALENYKGEKCFLGIDSGSTTTKIVIFGENQELLFRFYRNNKGKSIETVNEGLSEFKNLLEKSGKKLQIARTGVTGYGEDLIRAAFGVDMGMVETIAHFTAAHYFNPKVSFILDIGGQDMKAIFVNNGMISRIELNESCSSGCGSFIETFGNSLNEEVGHFAKIACNAQAPCDLGTRCTVFMNSKVKQALRENASIEDIAAGLSFSVIKNALFKVLKLVNMDELGENIVVQGGTFRNPSIQRVLEQLTGKKIICSNIPELMGAFGAALLAQRDFEKHSEIPSVFVNLANLQENQLFTDKQIQCKGCENFCNITKFTFSNQNIYFSGNKCEKVFTNKGIQQQKGFNVFAYKHSLLFDRIEKNILAKPLLNIGIPRVLNTYENFPFWFTLFSECNIQVTLSAPSTMELYEKGMGTIMSDSICFPAKLVHGHIIDLAEKKVDRIFYPMVMFEEKEYSDAVNSFNCPIVSSYADVIRSAVNPEKKYQIPFDSPTFNISDKELLLKACVEYLKKLGISKNIVKNAFEKALFEQRNFKENVRSKVSEVLENARVNNEMIIMLASRPYHTDPLINHKTPDILTELGVSVISEDSVVEESNFFDLQTISQWTYPNRIYKAAQWVAKQPEEVQYVQLNSFGCGPDALVFDEAREILKTKGKNLTLIRIDEITSTGSVRLRLRSMIESYKVRDNNPQKVDNQRITLPIFEETDKKRTILLPLFSEIYSRSIPTLLEIEGYKSVNLPAPDRESVELGLKYCNNEICYPATIVIGDILKALKSGKYKRDEVAACITQTCGQCRASSYLSLIKKGMIAAGFSDIPITSIGTEGKVIHQQPGFQLNWKKLMYITFAGMLFCDVVAKMYYSTVVREVRKGTAKTLMNFYLDNVQSLVAKRDVSGVFKMMKKAVEDFNQIEIVDKNFPKIGIVGEIYIKYNSFGNHNIVEWLNNQGVEVVVPPILDFFLQSFVNIDVNKKANLTKTSLFSDIFVFFIEQYSNYYVWKTNKILSKFRLFSPFHSIRNVAKHAEKILNLVNQFGEGWIIPAEISQFAEDGINNVISIQPFGCIANHVVSKGVEKRIKDLHPKMSLLFLDFDSGVSEVNVLNRLYFMVKNVSEVVHRSQNSKNFSANKD